MKKIILAVALLASGVAFAGGKSAKSSEKAEGFGLIHVADLEQMMTAKSVFIFDANKDDTRSKDGVIPGAKLLKTSSSYDIASTLPADHDSKLVFYCANTDCMASHDAAKRAVKAGYKNVNVMADGIQGWKKAGKPTERMAATHS